MPIFNFIKYLLSKLFGKNRQLKIIIWTNKFNFLYIKRCVPLKLDVKKKKITYVMFNKFSFNHDNWKFCKHNYFNNFGVIQEGSQRKNGYFQTTIPPCHQLSLICVTHAPHVTGQIVTNYFWEFKYRENHLWVIKTSNNIRS